MQSMGVRFMQENTAVENNPYVKRYGDILQDLAAAVGECIQTGDVEGLAFITSSIQIILQRGEEIADEIDRTHGHA
jgi:hypothetical protein